MLSRKVSINCTINFNFSHFLFKIMQTLLSQTIIVKTMVLNKYFYCILIHLLLILSDDVESNPGPIELKHNLSVLHAYIRSNN